ncbi:MAG: hypothetical protein M3R72_05380 [Bacteroidota bacterium]|nr:hypothetical protein [Bacteroidota bacterium]
MVNAFLSNDDIHLTLLAMMPEICAKTKASPAGFGDVIPLHKISGKYKDGRHVRIELLLSIEACTTKNILFFTI